MSNIVEELVLYHNSRYRTKLYLKYQGFNINEKYEFTLTMHGRKHLVKIKHFGLIQLENSTTAQTLIDFLDDIVTQKRQTIVNNIAKCYGLPTRGQYIKN